MKVAAVLKAQTGISGFDDVTGGGLPVGRTSLFCGSAGCGKTLFGMTFLVHGATHCDENGVFVSFEEPASDLAANVASLGYDVGALIGQKRLHIDYVQLGAGTLAQAGDYDLEGLFVRLEHAVRMVNAKRVVLDTLEALFSSFADATVLRSELRRLFEWLKERNLTTVVTAERGQGQLTRNGIEEYVSDCVILLDNRVENQVTTRRLRIVKYRGSAHGTNEYPFLIDEQGITVLPITSAGLAHKTSERVVSTGVPDLDAMLGANGFYVGSSILISGLAGTGKTTFSAHFVSACVARGERTLFFAFEESPEQIQRNMRSVGLEIAPMIESGMLHIASARPSFFGLEMHLARMFRDIVRFSPQAVVVDPVSSFRGEESEVHATLLRLIDILKSRGITAVFTSLASVDSSSSINERSVSSLMDTWISLSHNESNGERNRLIYVLKARGMAHSNQVREFEIRSDSIRMMPAYIGAAGVLTGAARVAQEARDRKDIAARQVEAVRRQREFERKQAGIVRQIADLQASLHADEAELRALQADESDRQLQDRFERSALEQARKSGDEKP